MRILRSGLPAILAACFVFCSFTAADAGQVIEYEMVDLSVTFGRENSGAFGLDPLTTAVGQARVEFETHAFVWRRDSENDLGTLGGEVATAFAMNADGVVVGQSSNFNGFLRPFIWDETDGMRDFTGALQRIGGAFDINDAGQVAGFDDFFGVQFATLWDPDDFEATQLAMGNFDAGSARAINAHGDAAGWVEDNFGAMTAARWIDGQFEPLTGLGGEESRAFDINDSGQAVGFGTTTGFLQRPVLWQADGSFIDFGTFGGDAGAANAINNEGVIVGTADDDLDRMLGFIRRPGEPIRNLNALIADSEQTILIAEATAINDQGVIAGFGTTETGEDHALLLLPRAVGDLNGDFVVNGLDIPDFKQALANPAAWEAETGRDPDVIADYDGNGVFNGLDIPGFKADLADADAAVPEPATALLALAALGLLGRRGRR